MEQLLVATLKKLPLQGTHSIDQEQTIEMIQFMLDGAGEQTFRLQRYVSALPIQTSHENFPGALYRGKISGYAEAPLFGFDDPFSLDDHRIDENDERRTAFPHAQIDDAELLRNTDLICRQSNAMNGLHRLDHILDEPLGIAVYFLDRDGLLFQNFFRIFPNLEHRHNTL